MSSYTQILYQLIFRTKRSEPTLIKSGRQTLYNYLSGVLKNKKCFCYQIGGVEDHLHIIFSLHPSVSLAKLVQDLKVSSNKMIKEKHVFANFDCWAAGYSAFTYNVEARYNLIKYVQRQEVHHAKENFETELRELYKEHGIEIDENFFLND
jgi:REP element-mobilizing transposase RayT